MYVVLVCVCICVCVLRATLPSISFRATRCESNDNFGAFHSTANKDKGHGDEPKSCLGSGWAHRGHAFDSECGKAAVAFV